MVTAVILELVFYGHETLFLTLRKGLKFLEMK